jgi:hypothetical protein
LEIFTHPENFISESAMTKIHIGDRLAEGLPGLPRTAPLMRSIEMGFVSAFDMT